MKYPRFYLKVFNKKGEMVFSTATTKKGRVTSYFSDTPARIGYKYWVRVVYGVAELANPFKEGKKEVIDNEGVYDNKADAVEAYQAFSSKDQINQIGELFSMR